METVTYDQLKAMSNVEKCRTMKAIIRGQIVYIAPEGQFMEDEVEQHTRKSALEGQELD